MDDALPMFRCPARPHTTTGRVFPDHLIKQTCIMASWGIPASPPGLLRARHPSLGPVLFVTAAVVRAFLRAVGWLVVGVCRCGCMDGWLVGEWCAQRSVVPLV